MSEWQPIETAPHDGTWILVTGFRQQHNGPISHMFAVAAFFPRSEKNPMGPYEWFYGTKREQYIDSPTHWMPLPNQLPPKPVKPKRQLQVVTLPKRNIKKP